ncbi:MAG: LysR family transcriptional regulator [Pseudoxanthomonas suwonensis]|nr:LysR family transcriptional regulator [Pseudoxanthomonas suwonensis]
MVRFRQIEVFHAVYTAGSISAAARALHVSQPSVSKVLHHTQQQLGFELFKLVRGRLVATDAADQLFLEVSEVYKRVRSLRKAVEGMRDVGGRIRVAVVPSLALQVLPVAIARFRKRHPDVMFTVHTLHHDEVFDFLYERRCDIAIGYEFPGHPRLERHALGNGQLVAMYRRDDPSVPAGSWSLADLEGRPVIGVTSGGPIADRLERELQRKSLQVREVVSNQTFYVAAALTRCGAGVSIVDEFTGRAMLDAHTDYRPFDPPLEFRVQYAYLEDRAPSKTAQKFTNLFAKVLAEARADDSP